MTMLASVVSNQAAASAISASGTVPSGFSLSGWFSVSRPMRPSTLTSSVVNAVVESSMTASCHFCGASAGSVDSGSIVQGMNLSWIVIAVVAFLAMEPITAATHRWIMHGVGEFLHRSHHQQRTPVSRPMTGIR